MSLNTREVALQQMETKLDTVLDKLGDSFTFQKFRQRITQEAQSEYIDILVTCQHNAKPFGVAHQVIGNHFRPILIERYGYQREVLSKDVKNIFGDDADRIVYHH